MEEEVIHFIKLFVLSFHESSLFSCECKDDGDDGDDSSGCEFPDWANDNICDDGNNNAGCNFDGGACCQENPPSGWNDWCKLCECKEDGGGDNGGEYKFMHNIF